MSYRSAAPLTAALLCVRMPDREHAWGGPLFVPRSEVARPVARPMARGGELRHRLRLRLDEARARRVRLAAAHLDISTQAFVTRALDHYIDAVVPTLVDHLCSCLEARAVPPAIRGIGPFREDSP